MALCNYWVDHGCLWSQPYDAQMGAGTFHPHTFLKGIGPEPWRCVYVQPCRRPVDGRYGKSPYRFQHYYQLQVLLKPAPSNIIDVFLKSLEHVGINLKQNDVGLLEDDWKGPTLGAWGLGWEVRANGQEVTQFTYFQQLGGIDLDVVSGEITYGLERLFMYAKGYKNALDIPYNKHFTLGDIFYQNENEFSFFNFKEANVTDLFLHFEKCEKYVFDLCEKGLVLPAYDYVLQASHAFNLLDSRGAISATERQRFIGRVRNCAKACASRYQKEREKLEYPMLNKLNTDARIPIISNHNKNELKNYSEIIETEKNIYSKEKINSKNKVTCLFELGVEEMPPSFQKIIPDKLSEIIKTNFVKEFSDVNAIPNLIPEPEIFVSSRRIGIMFKEIPQKISREAPNKLPERIAKDANGNFSQAAQGFAKKNGIDLKETKFNHGFLCYDEVLDIPIYLGKKFEEWCLYLAAITPLKMKWLPADVSTTFIRPVRWITALVDDLVIPVEMFGLKSGRFTCGQRILNPDFISIDHAESYEHTLKENHVVARQSERKKFIDNEIKKYAKEINGSILNDPDLFIKCVYSSENPYVFLGSFDKKYLRLPQVLITSVLKEHMNYFSVVDQNNNLMPYYIGVGNYKCENTEDMIIGTQNVVSGRLDDGAFYYDTDLNTPLVDLNKKLESQVFQENMGTLFDKEMRLKEFCGRILDIFSQMSSYITLNKTLLKTAAEFCKADLKTGCVQEFPDEMQGIMGGILFEHQDVLNDKKESHTASVAIAEHYLPKNIDSPLPQTKYGLLLSLADKMDSLCMMISNGVKVEGNKDPFGMRRLAISILRLLGLGHSDKSTLEFSSFNALVNCWIEAAQSSQIKINENFKFNLQAFVFERVKSFLKEDLESISNTKFDIRIVEALERQFFNKPLTKAKEFVFEINERLKQTEKNSLRAALIPYHRAKNIIQNATEVEIDESKFTSDFESNLYAKLLSTEKEVHDALEKDDLKSYLNSLQNLTKPLAELFENVMINDPNPDLKQNRISMLCKICALYERFANFSLIQVQ